MPAVKPTALMKHELPDVLVVARMDGSARQGEDGELEIACC